MIQSRFFLWQNLWFLHQRLVIYIRIFHYFFNHFLVNLTLLFEFTFEFDLPPKSLKSQVILASNFDLTEKGIEPQLFSLPLSTILTQPLSYLFFHDPVKLQLIIFIYI